MPPCSPPPPPLFGLGDCLCTERIRLGGDNTTPPDPTGCRFCKKFFCCQCRWWCGCEHSWAFRFPDRYNALLWERAYGEKVWHHETGLEPFTGIPPLPNCEMPTATQPRWCPECIPGILWCSAHDKKCGEDFWDACPFCFRVSCFSCSERCVCPCEGNAQKSSNVSGRATSPCAPPPPPKQSGSDPISTGSSTLASPTTARPPSSGQRGAPLDHPQSSGQPGVAVSMSTMNFMASSNSINRQSGISAPSLSVFSARPPSRGPKFNFVRRGR
jgi:hypothetical protein